MKSSTIQVVFSMLMASALQWGCATPAPAESAWATKNHDILCDRVHACLSEEQRKIPYSFYLGKNAGDCKAVYDETFADAATVAIFAERDFDSTEANKCSDALAKLDCASIKKLAVLALDPSGGAGASQQAQTDAAVAAYASLGVPTTFNCRIDSTTCDAGVCSISTNAGACAIYKYAPLKDANLRQQEVSAYTTGAAPQVEGCASFPAGVAL